MAQGQKHRTIKKLSPPKTPIKPPVPREKKTPVKAFSFAQVVEAGRDGYASFLTGRLKNAVLSCSNVDSSLNAELSLARGMLAIAVSDHELDPDRGPSVRTILEIINTISGLETSIATIRTRFSATPAEIKQTTEDLLRVLSDELSPEQLSSLAMKLESIKWPSGVSVGVNPSTAMIPVSNGS